MKYYLLNQTRAFLSKQAKSFLAKVNPEFYIKNRFKSDLNYAPNFKNPKTHNERMAKRKFVYTKQMTILSDKIAVREYISKKIGKVYLVPLLFEMDSISESIYNQLPNSFVLKANHGSGFNLIVKDKSEYSFNELKKITDKWLKNKYHLRLMELHYKDIKPRLLVEELLIDKQGQIPKDYKFYCFKNKTYLGVYEDRFSDKKVAFFDEKWKNIEYPWKNFNKVVDDYSKVKKPENFDEMLEIVSKLSQPFDHVRLDLYSVNNKIYFSEFTFTAGGGLVKFVDYSKDVEWGKLWDN